jgi:NitT/TauT family transport system substrate-binding protein
MLACVGLTVDDIEQVPVGFSSVELGEDIVDILPVFSSNEPRILREEFGLDIRLIDPQDWCFVSVGTQMLVNTEFAADNPEAVAGFLRATIRATEFMLENKDETLEIIARYAEPEVAENVAQASFLYDATIEQIPRDDGGCLMTQTQEQWESQIQQLADLGLLPSPPVTELLYDNRFIEMAYADLTTCELSDDPFLKDGVG